MARFKNFCLATLLLGVWCIPASAQFTSGSSGSDSRAQHFNQHVLPKAIQLLQGSLRSGVAFQGAQGKRLDPNRLFLLSDYQPRVYNVRFGSAGYNNGVEMFIRGLSASVTGGSRHTIFQNVKSFGSGDFVDLGIQKAGTLIDPILIVNQTSLRWYTNDSSNSDGKQHVIAYLMDDGFVLLGWEDLPNLGDRDYEDVCFVLDLGVKNTEQYEEPNLPH
ncbi:MAG: DUF4114 domain-containing protein [Planctomycetota bacterium]